MKKKLFRVAAVSGSLRTLLTGQLRFLNSYYEVVGLASEGESHKELTEKEGIRTISVNINRKISLISDIQSLVCLYIIFRKEKPFIVHSITPKAGLLSMIAAYLARVPHRLHTFTGLVFPSRNGYMRKMLIFFDKLICKCATNIYPEGQGVKDDLINHKITKKELKIIGYGNVNGIDLNHYNPNLYTSDFILNKKNELGIMPKDFVFLFVGRVGFDKGITELITAFVAIQKTNKNVKLLIVGPYEKEHDPLPPKIEKELDNNPGVISVGWQNDVRPFFSLANVFVLPSYREGFPNVVLQAGAMGKYSIVTDINGSNEIIQNNVNGRIIPVKNSDALTHEMGYCLQNRDEFFEVNNDYRKLVAEKYENSIVWNAMLAEYQSFN